MIATLQLPGAEEGEGPEKRKFKATTNCKMMTKYPKSKRKLAIRAIRLIGRKFIFNQRQNMGIYGK